jgi:hypothetical protein
MPRLILCTKPSEKTGLKKPAEKDRIMERFEYEITRYGAEDFSKTVYFCSPDGDCALEEIPSHETQAFTALLNGRGQDGWELVQLVFGRDGVMAYWKRRMAP